MEIELDKAGLERYYVNRNFGLVGVTLAFLLLVILIAPSTTQGMDSYTNYHMIMFTLVILGLTYLVSLIQSRQYHCSIEDNNLCFLSGIIVRRKRTVPLSQITDLETYAGVFERAWGITLLKIQTAGRGATSQKSL